MLGSVATEVIHTISSELDNQKGSGCASIMTKRTADCCYAKLLCSSIIGRWFGHWHWHYQVNAAKFRTIGRNRKKKHIQAEYVGDEIMT
jgi:hypothetical protein